MIECTDQSGIVGGPDKGGLQLKTLILEKTPDIVIGGLEKQLVGGTRLNDLSLIQKKDPVCQFKSFLYIVCYQNNRFGLQFIQLFKIFFDVGAGEGIEGAEGSSISSTGG